MATIAAPDQGSTGPAAGTIPTPHGLIAQLSIELIGVGLMGVFANFSEGLGRVMLTLMIGFFIIWFLINIKYFQSLISKV